MGAVHFSPRTNSVANLCMVTRQKEFKIVLNLLKQKIAAAKKTP